MAKKTRAEAAAEKAELVAKATALGIAVEGKNVTQLAAAIKQASEGGDTAAAPGTAPVEGNEKGATVAHVRTTDGAEIRSYSKAEHGAVFMDLAKEFAGKEQGRVVVPE